MQRPVAEWLDEYGESLRGMTGNYYSPNAGRWVKIIIERIVDGGLEVRLPGSETPFYVTAVRKLELFRPPFLTPRRLNALAVQVGWAKWYCREVSRISRT